MSSADENLGHKAATGAVWATIDRFTYMGLQFVVNMVLARLLLPSDYGIIGMLTIFIAVSQILIDGGFSSALIQKKQPTQTDYSTIFYWNTAFSCFLYFIIFAGAPLVARFNHLPELCPVLRAIGLSLILSAPLTIQQTRLRKALAFKILTITNLTAYILSAITGIYLAYHGFGVWSLVTMQLLSATLAILILQIFTRWHPSLTFSKQTMRELFSFGGFIMAANVLQTACQNLQGLIIGHKFNDTQTGYYSQAYKLDQVTSYSLPQVIIQVMYPVYASIQDDRKRLTEMVLMNIRVICLTIFPILFTLILVAEPLFVLLYGAKWLPSAPYFRILCVGGLFMCLQNVNFYAVAAVGRSKALFNWSIYKWGFLLQALIVGIQFGITGLLWGMALSAFNIFMVNAFLAHKYVGIHILEELRVIGSMLLTAFVAFAAAFAVNFWLGVSPWLCAPVLLAVYAALVFKFHPLAIEQFAHLLRRLLHRN